MSLDGYTLFCPLCSFEYRLDSKSHWGYRTYEQIKCCGHDMHFHVKGKTISTGIDKEAIIVIEQRDRDGTLDDVKW